MLSVSLCGRSFNAGGETNWGGSFKVGAKLFGVAVLRLGVRLLGKQF